MKTPKEWVNEYSQSGPFDLVGSTEEAEQIVKWIQADAVWGAAMCVEKEAMKLSGDLK